MNTQDLHQTRLNTEADVNYTVVPNPLPSSQEAAPYLGRTHVSGSYNQDDVAREMAAMSGCPFDVEAIKLVWNATGNYVIDHMAEDQRPYDLGFVTLRPAISGKFPTIDAPFDKERNRLYVAATPPDEIRNALAGDSPTKSGASAVLPEVSNVSWNKRKMTIKSGEPFEIVGAQLTLVVGDEKAELIPPHGNPVAVDLDPIEDGAWQRISGRLKQPVDACEGATLKLWTHGLDSTSQLFELKKSPITVLAGEEPVPTNPPHIDRAWPTGDPEEFDLIRAGDSFTVRGENLQGASWKISHADDGEHWEDEQAIPADKVTFVGGNAVIDEQWLDVYFNNCNLGEQILIVVENAAGSDFVRRELASV